ncbi:MAG: CDP-alcohol phosphatidyltransferase family protein [Phycisphaerales bacterium]
MTTPIARATGWYAHAPNALTLLRLVLAAGFFVCLALYRFPTSRPWLLILAAVLFIAAALTDALDGYLARRWNAETAFGRIMDPFADKVLVLGAFVFLAGPNFMGAPGSVPLPWTNLTRSPVSGVDPWMVVVIIARELLVTSMRGVLESHGVRFGADWAGKAKMVLQSVCVPFVIVTLWLGTAQRSWAEFGDGSLPLPQWCRWSIDVVVRVTVFVTVLSAVPYIVRGWKEARRLVIREEGIEATRHRGIDDAAGRSEGEGRA